MMIKTLMIFHNKQLIKNYVFGKILKKIMNMNLSLTNNIKNKF